MLNEMQLRMVVRQMYCSCFMIVNVYSTVLVTFVMREVVHTRHTPCTTRACRSDSGSLDQTRAARARSAPPRSRSSARSARLIQSDRSLRVEKW